MPPTGGGPIGSPPAALQAIAQGKSSCALEVVSASNSLTQELQECLIAIGYNPGPTDGVWGQRTLTAYQQFATWLGTDLKTVTPVAAKFLLQPSVPGISVLSFPPQLSLSDYKAVAQSLGCEVAAVRAVVSVEAAGSGFYSDGRPKILFEAQWFSEFTDGIYDDSHPNISSPVWNRRLYIGGVAEWDRLSQALVLNRVAALKSASWGLGQIMGFNLKVAGYSDVEAFVKDMHQGEGKQLTAMFNFIKNNGLARSLVNQDWASFALGYNGAGYRQNGYDAQLADAYGYWIGAV
jgi:N-acetylmuramidase